MHGRVWCQFQVEIRRSNSDSPEKASSSDLGFKVPPLRVQMNQSNYLSGLGFGVLQVVPKVRKHCLTSRDSSFCCSSCQKSHRVRLNPVGGRLLSVCSQLWVPYSCPVYLARDCRLRFGDFGLGLTSTYELRLEYWPYCGSQFSEEYYVGTT